MEIALTIIIIVLFIGTMGFFAYMEKRRNISEIERLREVMRAVKAKDAQEYENILPSLKDEPLPERQEDVLIPLEEVEPEDLLRVK